MTLQQIEYVLALEKYRHFVKAAESCFISQPTITLQIQKLEEDIGLKIFDRSTQPVGLTPLGKIFVERAKKIMVEVNQLKDIVKYQKEDDTGIVRIGIIPTLTPYLLPLFLDEFNKRHPKLFIEVEEMKSDDIMTALNNNKLDIGIMVTPLEDKNLREVMLFKEPFVVYANENHSLYKKTDIKREDLTEKGLWLLKEGHCFRHQVLEICNITKQKNPNKNFSFEGGSIETLKKILSINNGYTLVPELSVTEHDIPYVRKFKGYHPVREVSLVTNYSYSREKVLNDLREEIINKIPDNYIKNDYFTTIKWR